VKPVTITVSSRSLLRATLIGAVLAVMGAVIALLVTSGGGSPTASGPVAGAGKSGKGSSQGAAPADRASSTSASTTTSATTPAPPAPIEGASGAQLNDEGYALIQQGRYDEAVPLLQRAVAAFPKGTSDLDYAYALYNLGHALRLAGQPQEAVPILEQRLQIPNQVATVSQELAAARAEAGGGKEGKKEKKGE